MVGMIVSVGISVGKIVSVAKIGTVVAAGTGVSNSNMLSLAGKPPPHADKNKDRTKTTLALAKFVFNLSSF
jgi:hypothetical protein